MFVCLGVFYIYISVPKGINLVISGHKAVSFKMHCQLQEDSTWAKVLSWDLQSLDQDLALLQPHEIALNKSLRFRCPKSFSFSNLGALMFLHM